MYSEIADRIKSATLSGNKTSMFHLQVLLHAKQLADVDPVEFCRLVGAQDSYKTEFRKMLKVAELMEQEGIILTPSKY